MRCLAVGVLCRMRGARLDGEPLTGWTGDERRVHRG